LDDTYYIHGIWEVELSDEFKNKIGLWWENWIINVRKIK
jgi:hypothetical protein